MLRAGLHTGGPYECLTPKRRTLSRSPNAPNRLTRLNPPPLGAPNADPISATTICMTRPSKTRMIR